MRNTLEAARATHAMKPATQCEGWHRTGVFQMGGTGRWEQCKQAAVWRITFKREGEKKQTLPACEQCRKKVTDGKLDPVTIISVIRIGKKRIKQVSPPRGCMRHSK